MTNNTSTLHDINGKPATRPLIKTMGLLLFLGCSLLQGHTAASTTPPPNDKASLGYLKVFSTTQESQWGEGSYYYLHTGYRIYDSNGKVVKWVENHATSIDEAPEKVELRPGTYTVWAQSDKDGYVKVPVIIRLDGMTTVHLERSWLSQKNSFYSWNK
jgi:hypothetical protein